MNFGITNKDKKRAKATFVLLSVLFAICAVLTTLFGVLIPSTEVVKSLGDNQEIKGLVDGKDGSDYFLTTDTFMTRFDMYSNEEISTFYFSEVEKMLKANGDYEKLSIGSLQQWSSVYVGAMEQDFYILYDGNGNLFKLQDDGVNLTLTDDYNLAQKKRLVRGCDNVGEDLYVLTLDSDNSYRVNHFAMASIGSGALKSKMLWDLNLTDNIVGYTKIQPMSATVGILGFTATENDLYVFITGGGVIKLSTSLTDRVIDGEGVDFFTLADEYYSKHYDTIYENAYTEYFRNLMLKVEQDKYSAEQIAAASQDELLAWYGEFKTITAAVKKSAKDAAVKKAEEAFVSENPWCGSYDKATKNLNVATEYFDKDSYAIIYAGECAIQGITYSKKNEAVYYSNAADGYLYCAKKADFEAAIQKANLGQAFWANIATKITTVDYAGKKTFSSFGNGLAYNRFSNSLYIKFENERTLAVVDLNDMNNYQVVYEFEGDFDMYSLTGDKDNQVMHALRQMSNVDMKGNTTTSLYACTYEPDMFEQKSLLKFLFILFLALSVVLAGLSFWFFLGSKNDRTMLKIKTIQKDLQKNRRIYLMMIIFITLLIMFCYYEAIGAISMSFFDYTREKPAWIWNNFGNYKRIFNQPDFWLSVKNMLFFLVFDLLLCIVPPLIFAYLLTMIKNARVSNWVRSLMFIPGIIPSMATMLIWREGIYGTDGAMNQLISFFGAKQPIEWLMNTDYARWALIFMGFPFVGGYLIFYGGMMNIPSEYHEAGRLEGLGSFKSFVLIDIPLIMPQIKYIFIMTFIDSAQNYARTYILGSSQMRTPVHNMYDIMMGTQADYGMASAYATIIFVFLFAAVATNFKLQKKDAMGDDL